MIGSCIVMLVLLCGLVGGFFNAMLHGDIALPRYRKKAYVMAEIDKRLQKGTVDKIRDVTQYLNATGGSDARSRGTEEAG